MKDEDLRDFFAGLAMLGMLSAGRRNVEREAYKIADNMIEAKYYEEPEAEEGITAIKPKRKRSVDVPTPDDDTRRN
jgi:hypothetical protein